MTENNNSEIWVFLSHSNKECEKVLNSESGSFFVNEHGVPHRYEPSVDNPYIEDESEKNANYKFKTNKSIRTFIVPEGVKGFVSDFMRGIRIVERFELSDGLLNIGNNTHEITDIDAHCVFADCILPAAVIPDSLKEIGTFAFGHSYIDNLQLPESLHSPYGMQFKDSYIGALMLPKVWKDGVSLGKDGELQLNGWWFDNDKYGYLRWPSTKIGKMKFY